MVLLVVLAVTSFAYAEESHTSSEITLNDGSSIRGEFNSEWIRGNTLFAEDLKIDPKIIQSVSLSDANGSATVVLTNKDQFAIKISEQSYRLLSAIGPLEIPLSKIKNIKILSTGREQSNSDGLIFHCTFNDESSILQPSVGPGGNVSQALFSPGKSAAALYAIPRKHQADFDLPPNFLKKAGCIEFWAKILKRSSDVSWGGDPRFFTISRQTTRETHELLDIVSNNGAGNSGFSTWTPVGNLVSIQGMSALSYTTLFPSSKWQDWHHYAIIWDDNGIDGCSPSVKALLKVDGQPIACAKFDPRSEAGIDAVLAEPTILSFTSPSPGNLEDSTKSPFLIDEFKIWDYAKTDF